MADKNSPDKDNPKYNPTIEAEQRKLQAEGFYAGEIDGIDGPATQQARTDARKAGTAESERKLRQQEIQAQQAEAEASARAAEARTREAEIRAEQEAAERAPGRQAVEFGKFAAPVAGGMYLGHKAAEGTENRLMRMSPERQVNMSVPRRFAPYLARSATRFLPEAGLAFWGAEQLRDSNPVMSEVLQAGGTGLASAGLYNAGEGLAKSLTSPDVPGAPSSPVPQSTPPAPPQTPNPQALPAPSPAPQPSGPPMRHSERLKQTVTAAGGKPGKTKSANVAAIKRGLNPGNMPDVAESLSLPRDASRPQVLQRLREISRIGGKMVLPFAAGALAYDAATSDAQAATGEDTGSDVARGAAAGGAAAGAAYGMNRLLQAVPKVAPAMGAIGTGLSAYDYASQAQEAREGMPEGVPSDLIAQATPLAMRGMEGAQAWQDLPQDTREFVARNQSDPTMGMSDEVQAMPQQPSMPMEAVPGERGLLGRRDLNAANLEVPQNLPEVPAGYHQMPDGSIMADSEMQGGEGQPDFDQYIADLQAIFAEMEQGQQPQRRPAQTPRPAPPPAYGGQQNRLLQPTGY